MRFQRARAASPAGDHVTVTPEVRGRLRKTGLARRMAERPARAGIHVSPAKLDNAVFGYAGGLGRALLRVADIPTGKLTGAPEAPTALPAELPVVRAFAVRPPGFQSESVQRLYDRLDELEQNYATARLALKGKEVGRGDIQAALAEQPELRTLRDAADEIRVARQLYEAVRITPKLDSEQKRKYLSRIEAEVPKIARDALIAAGQAKPFDARTPFLTKLRNLLSAQGPKKPVAGETAPPWGNRRTATGPR